MLLNILVLIFQILHCAIQETIKSLREHSVYDDDDLHSNNSSIQISMQSEWGDSEQVGNAMQSFCYICFSFIVFQFFYCE